MKFGGLLNLNRLGTTCHTGVNFVFIKILPSNFCRTEQTSMKQHWYPLCENIGPATVLCMVSKLRYEDRAVPWYWNHIILQTTYHSPDYYKVNKSDHFRAYLSVTNPNATLRSVYPAESPSFDLTKLTDDQTLQLPPKTLFATGLIQPSVKI